MFIDEFRKFEKQYWKDYEIKEKGKINNLIAPLKDEYKDLVEKVNNKKLEFNKIVEEAKVKADEVINKTIDSINDKTIEANNILNEANSKKSIITNKEKELNLLIEKNKKKAEQLDSLMAEYNEKLSKVNEKINKLKDLGNL